MSNLLAPLAYTTLRDEIAQIIELGKTRARRAVEQERVHTYWEIGQVLHTHILNEKARADYGEQLLERLSEELQLSLRLLYQMLEVYRAFPILHTCAELSWSHYRQLTTLPNREVRRLYMRAAVEGNWSVRQLRDALRTGEPPLEIGQVQQALASDSKPLYARRGQLYRYRLVENAEGGWSLDLGFGVYRRPDLLVLPAAKSGAVVAAKRGRRGKYSLTLLRGRPLPYTYAAQVVRVIDGDTLWVEIDCGFDVWVKQKLRLRAIDCPELGTPVGQQARAFVEEALAASRVVVCTSRADKYDRYLADIFYGPATEGAPYILEKGEYLNRQLLREGLARRFDG